MSRYASGSNPNREYAVSSMMYKLMVFVVSTAVLAVNSFASAPLEEVVVTAAKTTQTIADVGSNISRIDNLDEIGQTHINEAMQQTSGVWISRGNGQEHLTAIRSPVLTGAGSCGAFLMAQDGIPLRASGFCNVNELFDVNSEQAGRIEVVKGPGSVLYGSNAMHGMINVITPDVDGTHIISAEAGPHDYYRLKATLGSDKWRVDMNGTSDGGYKDDSGFDQQKATLKYSGEFAGFDAMTVFSFSNLNQETAGFIVGYKSYEDGDRKKENPNPEAYRDSKSARLYSILSKSFANSELVLTPYLRKTRMEFLQHFLPGQAIENNGHESIGLQSAWHSENWVVGADVEFTSGFLEEYQPDVTDTGSAFLDETIPQGDHYDYDVDARTLAVFGEYTQDLGATTRLSLGARYEQVKYDYENNMLSGRTRDDGTACGFGGCRFSRPEDRSDTFVNFSPRLNITHYLATDHQVYFQLSAGYRAPQATELYRLQGSQAVSNIDSEELNSIELGFRGARKDLSYDLSTYLMEKDNFIFRDSNRATVDNGETSHHGIELSLSYPFSQTLSGDFVATYAVHEYENNPALSATPVKGNDIDTAPRRSGSLRVNWQPRNSINAELELIYLGQYFEEPANDHKYDGHSLVNVRLNFAVNDKTNAFIRVMNLADTDYAERADFSFGSDRYFVGEPRSIYAGISAEF